ncbi:MAG: helix-turn-helix transcriptional regulator [Saprospiraceae bacterium]|nr:helix-turn-helix transcriptional regulator [Saprospiraceae bacterium]
MSEQTGKQDLPKRKRGRPALAGSADTASILEVALKLFARFGYEGVSLAQLSEQTGVATSLFNYHFGSKEKLWQEALIKAYRQLAEDADTSSIIFKDLNPLDHSKAMTRWFIIYSAKHPALHKIMLYEMASRTGRGKWLMENIAIPLSRRLEFSQNQQIEAGIIKPIPVANWLSIILGACNTFFMMKHQIRHQYNIDVFDPDEIERHADVVVDILYRGIVNPDTN